MTGIVMMAVRTAMSKVMEKEKIEIRQSKKTVKQMKI
jgi:hypothetical protein